MSFQWWIAALHFIGQYSIALNEFCVLFVGNCDFVNHHKSLYLYVCWNAHILSHLITALLQLSLIPLSSLSPIKSRMTTFWYRLPRHTWKNGRWHADRQQCSHDHQEREVWFAKTTASCGLRGCKNRPAPFRGRMSYRVTKPGLVSVLYLSMRYTVLFIRAPFYLSLVFVAMCSVFWLFWLSCQYLPSEWLENWKTPLRKYNHGEGIISRKPRPKSAHDFLGLLYCFEHCFIMYLCCLVPLHDILSYCYGAI